MGSNTSRRADTRAVLDGIRRIVQSLRESSRRAEKEVGMSGAQLFVLQILAESPAVSLNELAARTHTHQSTVSAIVTRLVTGGLVVRGRSLQDGRTITLGLSPAGRRLAARAPHAAQERLILGIQRLPAVRRAALASALAAVAAAMDDVEAAPAMFFEARPGKRAERRHA